MRRPAECERPWRIATSAREALKSADWRVASMRGVNLWLRRSNAGAAESEAPVGVVPAPTPMTDSPKGLSIGVIGSTLWHAGEDRPCFRTRKPYRLPRSISGE